MTGLTIKVIEVYWSSSQLCSMESGRRMAWDRLPYRRKEGSRMKRSCEVLSTQLTEANGEHMATMCFKEGMSPPGHKSPSDL